MNFLFLIIPIAILVAFVGGLSRLAKRRQGRDRFGVARSSEKSEVVILNEQEDQASQWLLVLSACFLVLAYLALGRDLGWELQPQNYLGLLCLVSIAGAYWLSAYYLQLLAVVAFFIWWPLQIISWLAPEYASVPDIAVPGIFFLTLLVVYLLGRAHSGLVGGKTRFALVYSGFAGIAVVGLLFISSTGFGLEVLNDLLRDAGSITAHQAVYLPVMLLVVLLACMLGLTIKRGLVGALEAGTVVALAAIVLVWLFTNGTPLFEHISDELTSTGVVWAIVLNVSTFLLFLLLLLIGHQKRVHGLINVGSGLIFLFIIVKYFDWFFEFLDKSLFFIIAGVLLFGLGWAMERARRSLLLDMATLPPANNVQNHE